jgi:hypothetical protein
MIIKPLHLKELLKGMDLIPHAILSIPVWYFAKYMQMSPEEGADDLDQYIGIGVLSDEFGPFAIMRYRGYPEDTSTIYLPRHFPDDVDKITQAVHSIVKQFGLSSGSIMWERKDDPTL